MDESNRETVVGQQIGKYALLRELGSGASGTVYLAEDTSLGREVALKVMHPQLARDSEFLARFRREARLVASLVHPNIVRIHAFDVVDGQFVIDTEFLAGGALSAHCARSIFDGNTIARVARDVLSALELCHSRDILHRDIKPSNILLDDVGNAQVADFGIAKALEIHLESSLGTETSTGIFLGTPRYAPPEAWEGQKQTVQSDIYSLGVVLHEMVTGRPPYEAHTPLALMREMLTSPVCKLDPETSSLSPALAGLINDMVRQDPAERPADASQAIARLRETPEGDSLSTPEAIYATQRILVQSAVDRVGAGRPAKLPSWRWTIIVFAGLAAALAGWHGLSGLAPPSGNTNPQRTEMVRQRYTDVIGHAIPSQHALNTLWRSSDSRVYSGTVMAPVSVGAARWVISPTSDENAIRAIAVMPSRMAVMKIDIQTGDIEGAWAAFENEENTILRHGDLTGKMVGFEAEHALTLTLERISEQDQFIERETWHLDPVSEASDLAVLLELEANPRLQLLLFDELLPRRLPWAVQLVSLLPALKDQSYQVGDASNIDPGPTGLPTVTGDDSTGRNSLQGVPRDRGARSELHLDASQAIIEFYLPDADPGTTAAEIVLSPVPGVSPDGQRQRPLLIPWNAPESRQLRTSLYADAPSGWAIEANSTDEDLVLRLQIPLDAVPVWMQRQYWRMNARFEVTGEDQAETICVFGAPEFSAIEHGELLYFNPTVCGWP